MKLPKWHNMLSLLRKNMLSFFQRNIVTLIFLFLSVAGYCVSGATPSFYLQEIVSRFTRNAFLVLSLIIPIVAGIGLNFAIVIGAMAGQMGMIHTVSLNIGGFYGFLMSLFISTPLAVLFGLLTGKVLNKTKGNEMITSMILGYLANGIYQFVYLVLAGPIIPIPNQEMILLGGVGLLATCSLSGTLKYSLSNLWKATLKEVLVVIAFCIIIHSIYQYIKGMLNLRKASGRTNKFVRTRNLIVIIISSFILYYTIFNQKVSFILNFVDVSISTLIMISLLCLFNKFIFKTKIGQDFRAVGQNQQVAIAAGINVDQTRIVAIILSTVFSAWGQIIHLQDIGTINIYSSHEQVGLLSVAAILVGGASVIKANNKHALVGVLLFHAMFAISPLAGAALFDEAQVGEFFRVFIAYGIIVVALALNAINRRKNKPRIETRSETNMRR
jgi:simple sugar transport system permease protein